MLAVRIAEAGPAAEEQPGLVIVVQVNASDAFQTSNVVRVRDPQ
jgi:hypothetical protein